MGDGTALSIGLKAQQQNFQRQFSQELRVASSGHHFIDYQTGLYYFWQKVPGYGATQNGSDAAAWNLPTGTPAATVNLYNLALNGYKADSFSNATTKSLAALGQVDAHLTDRLTLTAGLRFTHEYKTGVYRRYGIPSGQDLSGLTAAQLATIQTIRTQFQVSDFTFAIPDTKSNALSGLATLCYKVIPSDGLLNGKIGIRIADGRYDFSFWARNLTNKNYYISRSPANYGLITAAVGDPRTVGATFRAKI